MTIQADGNVGIGTTSPSVPLHVNSGADNTGVLVESTDATSRLNLKDNSTSGDSYVGIGAVGNDLSFWANNGKRLTIQGGNVGIGTASRLSPSFGHFRARSKLRCRSRICRYGMGTDQNRITFFVNSPTERW